MSRQRPLQGGCSCGRNRYTIRIPPDAGDVAQVYFDNSDAHRRSQANPLSAWLRVPLAWYCSTTYAFFDDETHNSIRRCYTSPSEQNSKRHFCGICGTPLSFWSESPASEAEYISLTLGSLNGSDLRDLEELGLLPAEALEDAENDKEQTESVVQQSGSNPLRYEANDGLPWFDTMVEGSRLGKMRMSRGHGHSGGGRIKVEWEIVEWTDEGGDAETHATGKRKLGEVGEEDSAMEGVH